MLRPAIEYGNIVYKYMTTVSKVNSKDWRINMNMLQESTYTSALKRAAFSSSAISSGIPANLHNYIAAWMGTWDREQWSLKTPAAGGKLWFWNDMRS